RDEGASSLARAFAPEVGELDGDWPRRKQFSLDRSNRIPDELVLGFGCECEDHAWLIVHFHFSLGPPWSLVNRSPFSAAGRAGSGTRVALLACVVGAVWSPSTAGWRRPASAQPPSTAWGRAAAPVQTHPTWLCRGGLPPTPDLRLPK